jgi:hypothetical protein
MRCPRRRLRASKATRCIVSVELHEVECPELEAVFTALVRRAMQSLEVVLVDELGIDDRRLAKQRCDAEPGEPRCPIPAVAGEKCNAFAGLVDLQAVAVELDLVDHPTPLGRRSPRVGLQGGMKQKGRKANM